MGIPDQSKWVGVAPVEPPQSIPVTVDFEHVNNEQSFIRGWHSGGVAGQYTYIQLWNPAASGVDVYLTKLFINTTAAAAIREHRLIYHNAALTTLVGTGYNKHFAGANGKAELRADYFAGVYGTVYSYKWFNNFYQKPEWIFNPPIRLDESKSIIAVILNVNIFISCEFEWIEI